MCLAVLFFPPHIMQLTNFDTRVLWYIGSGTISRLTICAFLGIRKTSRFRISGIEIRNQNSELKLDLPGPPARACPGLSGKTLSPVLDYVESTGRLRGVDIVRSRTKIIL